MIPWDWLKLPQVKVQIFVWKSSHHNRLSGYCSQDKPFCEAIEWMHFMLWWSHTSLLESVTGYCCFLVEHLRNHWRLAVNWQEHADWLLLRWIWCQRELIYLPDTCLKCKRIVQCFSSNTRGILFYWLSLLLCDKRTKHVFDLAVQDYRTVSLMVIRIRSLYVWEHTLNVHCVYFMRKFHLWNVSILSCLLLAKHAFPLRPWAQGQSWKGGADHCLQGETDMAQTDLVRVW